MERCGCSPHQLVQPSTAPIRRDALRPRGRPIAGLPAGDFDVLP
jgi:hypothetical protein